jgi:hypothetical protein
MTPGNEHSIESIHRIERALVLLAYNVELNGDVVLPLYEKLEREYEAMKSRYDTRERARRLLASYVDSQDLRVIR